MESPVERSEEPLTTTKDPPKAEDTAAATTNDDRSDGANSPPPNCSICLGKLVNTSFTDSCLHQFCFTCLLQWSRIKTECPLCKQTFKSIIHNVRSEEDYDQYHVPRELAAQPPPPTTGATIDVDYALARASMLFDTNDVFRRIAYRYLILLVFGFYYIYSCLWNNKRLLFFILKNYDDTRSSLWAYIKFQPCASSRTKCIAFSIT